MPYPAALSNALLRADFLKNNGDPDPAIVYIRAQQVNAVGIAIITTSTVQVEAVGGRLATPIPVGDDIDLARPLLLEVEARFGGTPTYPRRPERWEVIATAADVQQETQPDGTIKNVVWLSKLIKVSGAPLVSLGMVRSVDGIQPDAAGNVDLPDFLTAATLTSRLAAFLQAPDFAAAVRSIVVATLVQGNGISLAYDGATGKLTITNTGAGSTPPAGTDAPGSFTPAFSSTL